MCRDPGRCFRQTERFGNIIIAAEKQTIDPVLLGGPGGEKQNRTGNLVTDHSAKFQTVHAGHVNIQQDEIGRKPQLVQSLFSVCRSTGKIPEVTEIVR